MWFLKMNKSTKKNAFHLGVSTWGEEAFDSDDNSSQNMDEEVSI